MRSKAGHGGSCPRCQTHDTAQRSCRTRERCSPRAMRRARRPAPARRACGRVSLARLRDGQLGAQRGVHAIAGHGEVGSRGALLAVGRAVRHAGDHLALAPLPPAWRRAASFGFFFFFQERLSCGLCACLQHMPRRPRHDDAWPEPPARAGVAPDSRRRTVPWRSATPGAPAAAWRRRCTKRPLWNERPATSPSKPSVGYPTLASAPFLNMQYPYTCSAPRCGISALQQQSSALLRLPPAPFLPMQ